MGRDKGLLKSKTVKIRIEGLTAKPKKKPSEKEEDGAQVKEGSEIRPEVVFTQANDTG